MSGPLTQTPWLLAAALAMLAAGCSARPHEIAREPTLSPVGAGIGPSPAQPVADMKGGGWASPPERPHYLTSIWHEQGGDLFQDPRARRRGDIVTVTISIKDKASLDNSSKRSRDSANGFGLDLSQKIDWGNLQTSGSATASSNVKANTSTDGKGEIARSESIDLRIAAVVVQALPGGKLLIEGSQEVRVNFELRVLTLTGIIAAGDIRSDNTISYERIAEARISYGGRGRIMEVQQPGWGQQIVDLISPF